MKRTWLLLIPAVISLVTAACGEKKLAVQASQMQTEITLPGGNRVYIDVLSENFPSSPWTERDILVSTFPGPDHYDARVAESFPGEKLLYTEGVIERENFRVELIPAARNEGDAITSTGATDYLVLITDGEWRILYCGDLGQDRFTEEQKSRIGKVDVCFASLENTQWCNMTLTNKKGFNLIAELNPRLVIPLRYKDRSLEYAKGIMPVYSCTDKPARMGRKRLPEKTSLLLIDEMAAAYRSIYHLPAWRD